MATIKFESVKVKATRRWKENGKTRRETRVFWQTINPFNLNAAGIPKTSSEIQLEILAERKVWLAEKSR